MFIYVFFDFSFSCVEIEIELTSLAAIIPVYLVLKILLLFAVLVTATSFLFSKNNLIVLKQPEDRVNYSLFRRIIFFCFVFLSENMLVNLSTDVAILLVEPFETNDQEINQ